MKRVALFSVGFIVVLVVCAWMAGVRLNTTGSLPIGLYIRSATGPLVEFCLQDDASRLSLQREYRGAGNCPDGAQPLLKPIAAQGGDIVEVNAGGISVNGRYLRNSAALTHDTSGRPLQHFPYGVYRVSPGDVWAISSYTVASWDSRYFGPVPHAAIRGRARELLVSH